MPTIDINLLCGKNVHYYVCTTLYALITADLEGLRNLLQFGFNVSELKMAVYNSDIALCCKDLLEPYWYFDEERGTSEAFFGDTDSPKGHTRKFVVNEVIVFLLKLTMTPDRKVRDSLVSGFYLVWRSRPTPYVRMPEVLRVLREAWINEDCPEKCWRIYEAACRMYDALFWSMARDAPSPRSLKHLSRCAVREGLMGSYAWSFGVYKLKIPELLKSYLLLEF